MSSAHTLAPRIIRMLQEQRPPIDLELELVSNSPWRLPGVLCALLWTSTREDSVKLERFLLFFVVSGVSLARCIMYSIVIVTMNMTQYRNIMYSHLYSQL